MKQAKETVKTKPTKKRLKKSTKPAKDFYTLPEAAAYKGVSRQAVWQAVNEGRLVAQRFGTFYLVSHDALISWELTKVKA